MLTVQNLYQFVGVEFIPTVNPYGTTLLASSCLQSGPDTVNCTTPAVPMSSVYNVSVSVGNITGPPFSSFTFDPAVITSISPNNGTGAGGYQISIFGKNFGTGCCVTPTVVFRSNNCTNPVRFNDSLITCEAPQVK